MRKYLLFLGAVLAACVFGFGQNPKSKEIRHLKQAHSSLIALLDAEQRPVLIPAKSPGKATAFHLNAARLAPKVPTTAYGRVVTYANQDLDAFLGTAPTPTELQNLLKLRAHGTALLDAEQHPVLISPTLRYNKTNPFPLTAMRFRPQVNTATYGRVASNAGSALLRSARGLKGQYAVVGVIVLGAYTWWSEGE